MKCVLKAKMILLGVFLCSISGINAQESKQEPKYNPTDVVGFQIQVMQERLKLNEAQMKQLIDLNKSDALRAKNLTTEEAKKVRNDREAKYKQILTAEQYAKWQAQRDEINKEAQYRYLTSDAYAEQFTKVISGDEAESKEIKEEKKTAE
jgi:hypothetical protein